jgi:lipopolysaccharide/colanic/teichoic acid biosynthesis glycosyltransferase
VIEFAMLDSILSGETQRTPLTRTERTAKRLCDVALAAGALILLSPLMLMAALAVRLDRVGPVIIRQRQVGFDGRVFFAYKFPSTPQIATHGRLDGLHVSKLGGVLKQSKIEELPQLLNVLKGEMSLVGPRLHGSAYEDQFGTVSSYANRSHLKPGMLGWPEVSGRLGEAQKDGDNKKRIALDLWYIDNWSLVLDLKIIWRSCFEVSSRL